MAHSFFKVRNLWCIILGPIRCNNLRVKEKKKFLHLSEHQMISIPNQLYLLLLYNNFVCLVIIPRNVAPQGS